MCDRNAAALTPLGIVDGVHAVMFSSVREFEQKLSYHLSHEQERMAIVSAARSLALARHTWQQRGSEIARAMRSAVCQLKRDRARAIKADDTTAAGHDRRCASLISDPPFGNLRDWPRMPQVTRATLATVVRAEMDHIYRPHARPRNHTHN